MSEKTRTWSRLTQVSYFALIAWLIVWGSLLSPSEEISLEITLVVWLLPALFALPGIIKSKLYTFAWLQFINVYYFCHAIWFLASDGVDFYYALIELFIVSVNFTAAIMAIRSKKK